MDPAYWAWTNRTRTPTVDPELAEYLREEYPEGADAGWLPDEPRRPSRSSRSDRGVVGDRPRARGISARIRRWLAGPE